MNLNEKILKSKLGRSPLPDPLCHDPVIPGDLVLWVLRHGVASQPTETPGDPR